MLRLCCEAVANYQNFQDLTVTRLKTHPTSSSVRCWRKSASTFQYLQMLCIFNMQTHNDDTSHVQTKTQINRSFLPVPRSVLLQRIPLVIRRRYWNYVLTAISKNIFHGLAMGPRGSKSKTMRTFLVVNGSESSLCFAMNCLDCLPAQLLTPRMPLLPLRRIAIALRFSTLNLHIPSGKKRQQYTRSWHKGFLQGGTPACREETWKERTVSSLYGRLTHVPFLPGLV